MASNSSEAEGSAPRKEPLHQMHIQKDGGLNPALARPSLREYLSSKENKAIMAVSAGNALEWCVPHHRYQPSTTTHPGIHAKYNAPVCLDATPHCCRHHDCTDTTTP